MEGPASDANQPRTPAPRTTLEPKLRGCADGILPQRRISHAFRRTSLHARGWLGNRARHPGWQRRLHDYGRQPAPPGVLPTSAKWAPGVLYEVPRPNGETSWV